MLLDGHVNVAGRIAHLLRRVSVERRGKNMNEVSLIFWDKRNNLGSLEVNGQRIGLGQINGQYNQKKFGFDRIFHVRVANDWNQSNPIDITAKTINKLIAILEKHNYRLVKF